VDPAAYPVLTVLLSALAALALGLLAQLVAWRVLTRVSRHYVLLAALVRATARPMRFVLPLFLLQLVWVAAPKDLPLLAQLTHATGLLLIATLTWLTIGCIRGGAAAIVALSPVAVADNLEARRILTQAQVIERCLVFLAVLVGTALMLMTFPGIRALGTSLLASAGLAGIVAGVAARPVLSNLIAGLQIALSQPIRIDDVLIVQGEWGRVEEITGTYVVVGLWDQRRLIVPLQWFIENPFQNWTRTTAELMGSVFLWVDYRMPLAPLREEVLRLCEAAPEWDRRFCNLQVTDTGVSAMQVRALVTAANSDHAWELRCKVREGLIDFVQRNYPQYLPRMRAELAQEGPATG